MIRKTTLSLLFAAIYLAAFSSTVVPFWDQHFSNGFPAGWTTGDVSGQNVGWEFCANPSACPPAIFAFLDCRFKKFEPLSFEDGYMFVNSFKHGFLGAPHVSYLRTPPVDCSQKTQVFIRFSTYIFGQTSNPDTGAVLRVKNGAGLWTTFTIFPFLNTDVFQDLTSWNPQEVLIDITSAAAGQANVQIEWRWTGNFEASWHLDDVELFDENPILDSVVWGAVTGQGDFAGGLNGWTVSAPEFDTCKWQWSSKPLLDFPDADTLANVIGCSPSYQNGVALINASTCNAYGGPSFYTKNELRSPPLNLSAVPPGTGLALQFSQSVAAGNTAVDDLPVTSVAVSIDGGLTFIDTIHANPTLPFSRGFCGMTRLDLPPEVAGNGDVRVHFIFSGDIFYWMIDDVAIVRRNDFDLKVSPQFFAVSPDYAVPASQVRPIGFFADLENIGQEPLNVVTAFATVRNDATQEIVFRDTLMLGTLMPGEVAGDVVFSKKFTPPPVPAKYTCTYWAAADEPDQDFTNNRVRWKFEVTQGTYSKAPGLCEINGYFTPNQTLVYEAGTCFFVPEGSKLAATSLSFAYKNASQLASPPGDAILQTTLYRWKTDSTYADANVDTIANFNEYEIIAINEHKVKATDNNKIINVPIDFENESVPLEDSTYYFVTVGYLHPVSNANGEIPFFIGGSEEIDYTSTFWLSYQLGIPAYVSMLRLGNDNFFRANAWALRRIPFVQLHVQQITETKELPPEPVELELFPNPAVDLVYLKSDLKEMQRQVSVEIFDICGRLVQARHFENTFVSQLPIGVNFLSNGSYTLRVLTENQIGTARLVVLR
jgi:hypothetical protein